VKKSRPLEILIGLEKPLLQVQEAGRYNRCNLTVNQGFGGKELQRRGSAALESCQSVPAGEEVGAGTDFLRAINSNNWSSKKSRIG